jgi:excisionase family DNA binding protein
MFEDYRDVLSIKDVADALNIKPYRVYRLIEEKKIKRLNIGKPYLIPKTELIRFVRDSVLV